MTLVSNNAYVSTSALYLCGPYLEHHGIKGQKWGVRRFQNEDGSLTSAGERRYGSVEAFRAHQDYKAAKKTYNKAFNKAYNKQHQAYSFKKSKRDANTKRWEDVYDAAKAEDQAKKKYKAELSKSGVTEKRKARAKKIVKIGAIAAGTALAAYGGYKLYQNAQANKAAADMARKMQTGEKEFAKALAQFMEYKNDSNVLSAKRDFVMPNGTVRQMMYDRATGASGWKIR